MTIQTTQCQICLDSPPYAECPGKHVCARMSATNNELMALIEFVRNHAADKCQSLDGATECRNAVQAMDCHAILTQWKTRLDAAIKE